MFSFSKLGTHGNLGNQLFEIASVIGLAMQHNVRYVFPEWQYAKYFKKPLPQSKDIKFDYQLSEPNYHYEDWVLDRGKDVDILGWLQSEKYFSHCENEIRELFAFEKEFYNSLRSKYSFLYEQRTTIAVSVRRGDYVENSNYYALSVEYYQTAIDLIKSRLKNKNTAVIVFSDDIEWCKINLPGQEHYMTGHNAIEQLALMTMCNHFVIANSSFSWWGAWLGETKNTIVVASSFWNAGELLRHSDDKDVVPDRWIRHNVISKPVVEKIDLSDVTFTIPIRFDHSDRKQNLELCLLYLNTYFDTNIIITEQDVERSEEIHSSIKKRYPHVQIFFEEYEFSFERTRLLNDMARIATTDIVVNWDCDVFIKPNRIEEAAQLIRDGKADGVYPYDGKFFRVPRSCYRMFMETLDFKMFNGMKFNKHQWEVTSFGGAIMWNKKSFIAGGMENEFMINYGPEDYERYERFRKLGYRIERMKDPLFHIDHDTSDNGSKGHDFSASNTMEYEKIQSMSKETLRNYVSTWPWLKDPAPVEVKKCPFDEYVGFSVCINLERRTDRKKSAEKEFKKISFDRVLFYKAIDGPQNNLSHFDKNINAGMVGCFRTHKNVLQEYVKEDKLNTKPMLVTEDDLEFISGFNTIATRALQQLPEDWEFVYLGWNEYNGLGSHKEQVNQYWVVPTSVWGTQAYMVRNKAAAEKLLKLLEQQETQIDMQLAAKLPSSGIKYYASFPSLVSQKYYQLGTDIQHRKTQMLP